MFTMLLTPLLSYSNDHDMDEVFITLNVERIGSTEISAIINEQVAYISVKDIFEFLKIKNHLSDNIDSISGFFINPNATFLIEKNKNIIVYQNRIINLNIGDLIATETDLYLRSNYFGEIFGLDCSFNFRSLSIALNTKIELPAIRERQLEQMRRNITMLKGEKKADTTIGRLYQVFNFGMADWSLTNIQQTNMQNFTRAYLGLGAVVAGGEATISLNYNSNQPIDENQQFYRWKYVNNNNKIFKQITAGKFFIQSTASVFAPFAGIQITNTPTTYKKSFGTYTLSNNTKPGWTVELYINNVLINYTKADASGFYTFEVPMVYGNSLVKLKFYGPWGEQETVEQNLNIPFNFVPVGKLEYAITSGLVQENNKNFFSRANLNYGLSRRITVGTGLEYLTSVTSGKTMPFVNASVRLGSSFLISAEHTYSVRTRANINYRLPTNLQFDVNYTRYHREQTAVLFNYLEEKKVVISKPFRGKKFSGFTRFTYNDFTLLHAKNTPVTRNTSGELLFSGYFAGISANLTTNGIFNDPSHPYIYSNLSLTFRLPHRIMLTPQIEYAYTQKNFNQLRFEVEKPTSKKGYINFSFAKEIINKNFLVSLGFRYNFSFAQTAMGIMQRKNSTTTTQLAKGSLLYENKSRKVEFHDQGNVGRGGLIIAPFVDINCNGVKDANEPKAFGLNLRINGGFMQRNNKDTTIRVLSLEAYNNYFIELDKNSFDNISWQLQKETISVTAEANSFKLIEIPVAVLGEVSGTVYEKSGKDLKGLGRMIINIYDHNSNIVGRLLSESDGFFSYMKLPPGTYTAKLDEAQLKKLNKTYSGEKKFVINAGVDGDVADGLEFIVSDVK